MSGVDPVSLLPDLPLMKAGPVSDAFRARGVADLAGAARHVRALPYGRISDRLGWATLVLAEGRGTCTTKHALLAELAREQDGSVQLTLGIYEMGEANTPGVGAVLARHGLATIPEAHCYLTHAGRRIDVTRAVTPVQPIERFLHEEPITPAQIGDYKIALHRRVLADWMTRTPEVRGKGLDEVWAIREACIEALGES